jgi:DNA modification methylase
MVIEVKTVKEARQITLQWIGGNLPESREFITTGLPEIDDRYDVWRVSLILGNGNEVGEIKINKEGSVVEHTRIGTLKARIKKSLDKTTEHDVKSEILKSQKETNALFRPAPIPNKVILGDTTPVLEEFPPDTAQLVITSPPYYNAKPQYSEFLDYQEYLDFLRKVIVRVHAVLSEGRFFVINVSPILIRRTSRSHASKRIPLPFDIHKIIETAGFEFIDDIIWVKPEGAGWNTGRGRRFSADRWPLQYKPVPVTEYVLVYRKKTNKLIDWNIRKHYDKALVEASKVTGDYDVTNVWYIPPGHHKHHPAVFPKELIRKLIRYYSFVDDLILDPFAGPGTVGIVALEMKRRFLLIDNELKYFKIMKQEIETMTDSLFGKILSLSPVY